MKYILIFYKKIQYKNGIINYAINIMLHLKNDTLKLII